MDVSNILSVGFGVVGGLIGVYGWFQSRDNTIDKDSKWKGEVNARLDILVNQGRDISAMKEQIQQLNRDVIIVTQSSKQAHKRLDEYIRAGGNNGN